MDKNLSNKPLNAQRNNDLVKQFENKNKSMNSAKVAVIFIVMIVLGLGSGLLIAKGSAINTKSTIEIGSESEIAAGDTFGVDDTKTFSDVAEGSLKEGGIEGEGQYHLERPGGETQYVYLTSSVVDLGLLEGRKIKVWGQTQRAQHVPWLMDVGRVEVLE
jgi:hypothetical protein